ncbi:MAG: HlyD family efflux transporter periplasmic adaptor subunit, partial [Chloroflexi bacterium]|nr:HlyD family efflux transporter periplasmic adaptor subunit [Chloroflexota bacterium]
TQDALQRLLEPTALDMTQAEFAVANASTTLIDAEDALAVLLNPTSEQMARADTNVTNARIALDKTQETLDALVDGPSAEDIDDAQFQFDSAMTALLNNQRDLELTQNEWADKLEAANERFDDGLEVYQGGFNSWLGIELDAEEALLDPDTLLADMNIDLDALFGSPVSLSEIGRGLFAITSFGDDPGTPWNEATVSVWRNFFPGNVVGTCDGGNISSDTQCVRDEIGAGWDTLQTAIDDLNTTELQSAKAFNNISNSVAQAEQSVAEKEESLADLLAGASLLLLDDASAELVLAITVLRLAEDALFDLENGADPADIEFLRAQVARAWADFADVDEKLAELIGPPDPIELEDQLAQFAVAQANLADAEERLAQLVTNVDPVELEAKQRQLAVAQEALNEAEEDLASLINDTDPVELVSAQKQVVVKANTVAQAEEDLAEVLTGADSNDVSLREAEVVSANAALDSAIERMLRSTLTAPWAGTISAIVVDLGQTISSNAPIAEIVDLTQAEVQGFVDEIDVLFVRLQATAVVSMDALPGQLLNGTVTSISAEARNQQGVVSFEVRIRVTPPEGLELPEGLSAVASVVIREDRGVLLIPLQALEGNFDQPLVRVKRGDNIIEQPVSLGNSDDFWTVITQGLNEGDQVVMQSQGSSATDFFSGRFRQFQGGIGGLGGGNFRRGGGGPR